MVRGWLLIGVTVLALAAPDAGAARRKPNRAEVHSQKGKELFRQERYDEAIAEYQAAYAITAAPKYLFNIGRAYHLQGKKQEALEHYRRYLTDDPNGAGADEAREYVAELSRDLAEEEAARAARDAPAAAPPPAPEQPAQQASAPDPPAPAPPAPTERAAVTVEPTRPVVRAFGPKVGIHAATIADPDTGNSARVGAVAGAFVTFAPVDWLAIDVELLYAMKGSRPEDGSPLSLHYVELPLLLRPTYRGWFAETGPYLAYLFHGDTAFDDSLQRVDVGLVFGAGYSLALGSGALIFEARFELGLTSVKEDHALKTRTFAFSLGYSFR